ncbi:acetyl-CoA C-acetyltransferase [Microbacterium thalassium]|uniref:Acetyl-CoA C-acetyltransferase n=1 Tax=Microbacterium thalassium TaxID=362649 RepID=A0A7X0FQB3_9MICO|nr:acetyl-CoA C-acetyltransferase [Microbacterium thalassium]MBB6391177.1 acetyl-CoA C-acetyltransferase [Microbacterium thalassium]GLK23712.1 acetyl-CoA acetyltransferase [Microbacterium thalassium]
MSRAAYIVAAVRSPIGRARKGSLVDLRPDDLVARMVRAALDEVPQLDPRRIDDLMIGTGQPAGEQGMNIGRIVSVMLGLDTVPGTTVNRYCASSVQTTRMAFHAILAGEGDVFVSAGVESVTHYAQGAADFFPGHSVENPVFADAVARSARRAEGGATGWADPRADGLLPDPYIAMGQTAENVAQLHGISREEQDAFAERSQHRAEASIASGFWKRDITPVSLPDGRVVDADDGPRSGVTHEGLAALDPVFRPDGTVTAGNACPLNDGAAALVIVSDRVVDELGLQPLARIVSTGVSALSPEIMGLGPVEASRDALARAGLGIDDIDLVEINEAFAVQVIASARELAVDPERLNVHGGAIAVGHPFGMTGARITTTLIHGLADSGGRYGLETMCVAGGQGMALVVERV